MKIEVKSFDIEFCEKAKDANNAFKAFGDSLKNLTFEFTMIAESQRSWKKIKGFIAYHNRYFKRGLYLKEKNLKRKEIV